MMYPGGCLQAAEAEGLRSVKRLQSRRAVNCRPLARPGLHWDHGMAMGMPAVGTAGQARMPTSSTDFNCIDFFLHFFACDNC